ncbi:MAG TPA: ATP-binding protein [Azonexus sp.]|nr:ATP-binding protein [Azonexus sp.]
MLHQDAKRVFDRLTRAFPDRFREILFLDPLTGKILASGTGDGLDSVFPDMALVKRATQSGATELIDHQPGTDGPNLVIVRQMFATGADGYPNGKLVGLIVALLQSRHFLGEDMPNLSPGQETIGSTILLNGSNQSLVSRLASDTVANQILPLSRRVASGFEGTIEQSDEHGNDYLMVYRHLPLSGTQGLTLVHFRSTADALLALKERAWSLGIVSLALTLLSLVWIFLAARRLTQPLSTLADTAHKFGEGKLSLRADIRPQDSPEIVSLARAFNHSTEQIQKAHETLESKVLQRTAELAQERDTAQRYLDVAGVMLIVLDGAGRITMINRKGVEILGLPEDRLLGMDWFEHFLPAAEKVGVQEVFRKLILGLTQFVEHYENSILDAEGHERLMSWNNVLLRNETGEITGILSSGEDITERKNAEQALIRHRNHLEERVKERTAALSIAKESAETANRAKSSFLANMSHELRTPMNAIIGLTHMLGRNNADAGQRNKLTKINSAANHLLNLLNDILDLSKIEAEKLVLENAPFRVGLIFSNIESLVGDKLGLKGLQLVKAIAPELSDLPLIGDALRLQQVLLNLVGNAIKFTEHGVISITAEIRENNQQNVLLYFEVSDTGIGIPEDALPRLFSPFEQADGSTTRKFGGTGLGLAISKRLIQLMGGEVGVRSTLDAGSTFWFAVRCALDAGHSGQKTSLTSMSGSVAEQILRTNFRHSRILLAEDDWVNQEVAMELLKEVIGLQVDLAADGEKAVEMATSTHYDLILMDIQMPKLDGIAATRIIRKLAGGESIPILAMTANAFEDDRQKCLASGMNDFIAKPVDPDMLFIKLLHWLETTQVAKSIDE